MSEDRLRAIYDEHACALRYYLLHMGQPSADADDIVQETMTRAWRCIDRLDLDHGRVRAWLYTVARRIAIDMNRKRLARVATVPLDEDWAGATDGGVQGVFDRQSVAEALAAMSPVQARVMVLRHLHNLTVRETAQVLGISEGTVKSRDFYGRRIPVGAHDG